MTTPMYVLRDDDGHKIRAGERLGTFDQVRRAYAERKPAVWLATHDRALRLLSGALRVAVPRHGLVALEGVSNARRVLLDALFTVVVEPGQGTRMLPGDELREVLESEDRADLFIGVRHVPEDDALVIFRGNLRSLIVPLSTFKPRKGGPRPDPVAATITDHGQTLRLGDYEAATSAILYDLDAEARRRARKRAVKEDAFLGASIRRLRLQRGLRLEDFSPALAAKTMGRIERGEVKPRAATLAKIAKRVGVRPDEISTF